MAHISWEEFEKVELRIGTIVKVEPFPEARNPAYKVWVDLGEELGVKKSSAQITNLYAITELVGRQVICVTNFPEKQIGPLKSQVLITGFSNADGDIVLASIERPVPNGAKLH